MKKASFFTTFVMTLLIVLITPVLAVEYNSTIRSIEQFEKEQPQDKWIAIDKVQHFSYSCLVALGFQYILVNKMEMAETYAMPVSLGLSFMAGITKEVQDSKSKNGIFSWKDLASNGLGILIASLIISIP
jgi:uncharacterized protein YfiM (DUF2279 family)